MPIIQVLLILGVCVGAGLLLVASPVNSRHLALRRIVLVVFVLLGLTAIAVPSLTTSVAHAVGVGRGADLLLYGVFVGLLVFVATAGRRHRELERKLTVLTRRLALDEVPAPGSDDQSRRP